MKKMKDSGIEWIGEIPEDWEVVRNKNIFTREKNIVGENSYKYKVLSLTMKGVIERDIDSNMGKMPMSFDTYQIVKPNCLLMCLFDMDVTPRTIGIINQEGIVSPAYTFLKVNHSFAFSKYYYYYYLMLDEDKQILHLSNNIRSSINIEEFGSFPIQLPPLPQQQSIADYLDRKCGLIDGTIERQKAVIEKLKQYKQSVITEAVTKGLNPAVKMKPSGIEWIGDLPEGWEVRKIKTLSSVKRGASPRPIDDAKYYDENGKYQWVRISDVTASDMYLLSAGENLSELGSSLSVKLDPGKLFISICATVGKPCITKINCCIHDGFVYFPELENVYTKWLYQIFICGECYGGLGKMGTQLNLNTETVGSIYIPIPSNIEIDKIIDYLDAKCAKIDEAINGKQKLIEKLTDYKKSLIYECVTGKR